MIQKFDELEALFDSPEKHTKFRFAEDADGDWCGPKHPDAACWCLSGGFTRVFSTSLFHTSEHPEIRKCRWCLSEAVEKYSGGKDIIDFNDHKDTTVEDVRYVIREAKKLYIKSEQSKKTR